MNIERQETYNMPKVLVINNAEELGAYLREVGTHYLRPNWTVGAYNPYPATPNWVYYQDYKGYCECSTEGFLRDGEYCPNCDFLTIEGLVERMEVTFPWETDDQRPPKAATPIKLTGTTPLEHLQSQFDLEIGVYNSEHWRNAEDAQQAGAIYQTRSGMTNYGRSWLYDIREVVEAASRCYNNEYETYVVVFKVKDTWHELTTELIEGVS